MAGARACVVQLRILMTEKRSAVHLPARRARESRFHDTIRSLKHRNFQLFFSGQLISLVGTWMDTMAEAWLVYRLTGSSLLLGTVTFAGQIPVLLISPFAGLVADRLNRRKVVITTQISSMIIAGFLAGLTLSKRITVDEVILLAALMGIVNAFDIPARQSFLVEMVGREDLMNAIALNSSMFNAARIVGPSIAGILVASIGEGWCFFANSVSYIAVIAGLLLMSVPPRPRAEESASPFEHIAEGFRFVRETAPIRALLLLLGLVSMVAMPYAVLMPIFAAKILHGNARTLGILMGSAGLGALIGALLLASRRRVDGLGRIVAIACASFGIALILFSFSRWWELSSLCWFPWGFRDDADGLDEHADSVDGAGPVARPDHGCLFDDVPGNGAVRGTAFGLVCGSHRRAEDGCAWRRAGNFGRDRVRAPSAQDSRASASAAGRRERRAQETVEEVTSRVFP